MKPPTRAVHLVLLALLAALVAATPPAHAGGGPLPLLPGPRPAFAAAGEPLAALYLAQGHDWKPAPRPRLPDDPRLAACLSCHWRDAGSASAPTAPAPGLLARLAPEPPSDLGQRLRRPAPVPRAEVSSPRPLGDRAPPAPALS